MSELNRYRERTRSPSPRRERSHRHRDKHRHSSSSSGSREQDRNETNEAYELYRKKREERRIEYERRAAAKLEGINANSKPRKLTVEDFPSYKRKLVVQNIPISQSTEDIMNYFFGILAQVTGERYSKNPLISVRRFDDLGFVTMEFRKRDDAEICLNLDGTEYCSGYKMKIVRVKRFIEQWNDEVNRGGNPAIDPVGYRVGGVGKSNFSGLDD